MHRCTKISDLSLEYREADVSASDSSVCFSGIRFVGVALVLITAVFMLTMLAGCAQTSPQAQTSTSGDTTVVSVASLKGPTSIGLVGIMGDASLVNDYSVTISGTVDEILPGIVKGDIDIALVPANVASTLYAKTNGGVSVIDVNTLGVLYVVTGDSLIQSLADLAGRTIYMTGKGTTPEYVMTYLLRDNGLSNAVTIEYKSEASEVAALLLQNPSAIGVLPEPYVTAVCARNTTLTVPISLTQEWDVLQGGAGSRLVTGVTLVRSEFLRDHPDVVDEFLKAHSASVTYVNAHPDDAAVRVVAAGIMDDTTLAAQAIPSCHVVCLTGDDMRSALSGYLNVLYEQNPASVGGALPGNEFYYGAVA